MLIRKEKKKWRGNLILQLTNITPNYPVKNRYILCGRFFFISLFSEGCFFFFRTSARCNMLLPHAVFLRVYRKIINLIKIFNFIKAILRFTLIEKGIQRSPIHSLMRNINVFWKNDSLKVKNKFIFVSYKCINLQVLVTKRFSIHHA